MNRIGFLSPRPLGAKVAPTYSLSDLAAVSLAAAVVALWAESAGQAFSFRALLACEAAFLAFYLVGSLFAGWQALATGLLFDLPLRLLVGYATVNTAMLVLAWISPLGIVANFGILLAVATALFIAARPVRHPDGESQVGLLVLGLSLAATTLWCQDSLRPLSVDGKIAVFKPWIDGFYHAVHLRIFGASHGAGSIEDFRLAGVPARLYHYGMYLTPAFIKQASGISAYTAFAGILAPMGVFFSGLGAYALVGSFWGAWPGFAACAALLLLPDGVQQGMQNTFMSYHWLTQISPSATYGLGLVAVAWLFVLRGCIQGNRWQVVAGWVAAGILAFYKLHFFIATALLLWLLPPLFFRAPLGRTRRILWAVSALALYIFGLAAARKIPGVPIIRFDGSSIGEILRLVKGFTPRGALRDFLEDRIGTQSTLLSNLVIGAPFILFAALGLFVPLVGLLAIRLRKHTSPLLLAFPLLLIVNFMAMFFGLALDFNRSTPDELSHRPVMVMYFGVVAWVGGAAGLSLLESRRLGRVARPVMIGLAILLMAIPAYFGAGVQRMWAMRMFSPVRVPLGLYRAAQYMRDHGESGDVFQDSQFDRTYAVAALSECRAFAARTMTRISHNSEQVETRAETIEKLMQFRNPDAIAATARSLGLRWFLLTPSDRVRWPEAIASRPAFELDGYRLYRF